MDPQLAELLREVEDASLQRGGTPRLAREAGQFLNLLVKSTRAVNILVVGMQDGYMLLWLAEAAAAMNGVITGIEDNVWQYDAAVSVLERSPHRERLHLQQGEFAELLPVLEGPYHFVLLDTDKDQTLYYFHMLFEQICTNALICCNHAMSNAASLTNYLSYVHDRPGLESILVPIGEGVEMTYKTP